jgi:hypothetical protein
MVIGYILLAISLAEFALGLWFLLAYRKQQSTLWYGLLSIAIAIYVGANGFGYSNIFSGQFSEHLAWVGGALTAIFILPFSYSFPLVHKRIQDLLPAILWPLLIFPPAILFTGLIVEQQSRIRFGSEYAISTGPYFWTFIIFFATYWILALINLRRSFSTSDGQHRSTLKAVLAGLITSLVISSIFDIAIPLFGDSSFGYIGPLCSAAWLGFTSYILVKR